MRKECVVRSRIDPVVKRQAEKILKKMGLTLSAGIRLFLCQVISDQAMPFKAKVPNAKTCAAIKAAHKGKVESVTIDQLRRDCHDATCGK